MTILALLKILLYIPGARKKSEAILRKYRMLDHYGFIAGLHKFKWYLLGQFIRRRLYVILFFVFGIGFNVASSYISTATKTEWFTGFLQNTGTGFITSAIIIFLYDVTSQTQNSFDEKKKQTLYFAELNENSFAFIAILFSISNKLNKYDYNEMLMRGEDKEALKKILTKEFCKQLEDVSFYSIASIKSTTHLGLWKQLIVEGNTIETTVVEHLEKIRGLAENIFWSFGGAMNSQVLSIIWELRGLKISQEANFTEKTYHWIIYTSIFLYYFQENCFDTSVSQGILKVYMFLPEYELKKDGIQ